MGLEGLFGAIQGGSQAVSNIAGREQEAQASRLAQKLKYEAELELSKRISDYRHGQAVEMAGEQSRLRREESAEEMRMKKEAGLFDKNPVNVPPFTKLVDPNTGKTIARGLDESASTRNAAAKGEKYTMDKQIDDLREQYKAAIDAAKEMAGYIDPKDKDAINKAYAADEQLIYQGQRPRNLNQFLMGDLPAGSTIRFIYKDGKLVPK